MKTLKLKLLLLLITPLFFQYSLGQNPAVSKKYTNEEIDKMVRAFRMEHSQNVMPSELLMQKFSKDFPKAYDIEWEKATNLYEVEFEIRGADYEAYYDEQGNLIMYKHDIYPSDLPELIRKKVKNLYPNYRFDDIEKIVKGTEVSYKVEMERGDLDVRVIVKIDGTIVSATEDY